MNSEMAYWHFSSTKNSLRAGSQWCEAYEDIDIGLNIRFKNYGF